MMHRSNRERQAHIDAYARSVSDFTEFTTSFLRSRPCSFALDARVAPRAPAAARLVAPAPSMAAFAAGGAYRLDLMRFQNSKVIDERVAPAEQEAIPMLRIPCNVTAYWAQDARPHAFLATFHLGECAVEGCRIAKAIVYKIGVFSRQESEES